MIILIVIVIKGSSSRKLLEVVVRYRKAVLPIEICQVIAKRVADREGRLSRSSGTLLLNCFAERLNEKVWICVLVVHREASR